MSIAFCLLKHVSPLLLQAAAADREALGVKHATKIRKLQEAAKDQVSVVPVSYVLYRLVIVRFAVAMSFL